MILPLKNGNIEETLNELFRTFLEKKVVDALVLPQAVLSGKSYSHTLITDPGHIEHAAPFLPLLMVNGASTIASLTAWDPGKTIGVVLRACEIRALIELTKVKQASLDRLMLIGVDCLGTMESMRFEAELGDDGGVDIVSYLEKLASSSDDHVRQACQVCPYPVPENVSINIGFIGTDLKSGLYFNAPDEVIKQLELETNEDPPKREEHVATLTGEKQKKREAFVAELKERFKTVPDLLNEFARCKRCYNCRSECPICYCKECVFLTNVFEHKPEQYFKWAERKGAIKLPYETLLFHLTRLNHMVFSCVECGLCSSACPNDLPVYDLFQYMGVDVQALFDYQPGKDLDEDPHIFTFREVELDPK